VEEVSEEQQRGGDRSVPLWLAAVVTVALMSLSLYRAFATPQQSFFDDSLMFYRYAMNMRHHLGISWNLDGVHTFGCTSMMWLAVIWVMSFLPFQPLVVVGLASTLSYFAMLAVMVRWLHKNASSNFLRSPGNALLLTAVPLEISLAFQRVVTNGMETMFSMLMHLLIALAAVRFAKNPTAQNALLSGALAFAAYETRPENFLCGVMVPLLLWLMLAKGKRGGMMAMLLGSAGALVGLGALAAKWYYGTPVPLAFYLKARHGYVGYIGYSGPGTYLVFFFGYLALYLAVILLLAQREDRPLLVGFGVPVLLTVLYLCTITQIMGNRGRYFVPFVVYAMLAAILMVDRALASNQMLRVRSLAWRAAAAMVVISLASVASGQETADLFVRTLSGHMVRPVPVPKMVMEATQPLPVITPPKEMVALTLEIADRLPAGSAIATTEVGYIGAYAPQVSVIDIAALNDEEFALHGFSSEALLARRPEVIVLPHPDYTGLMAAMLSDPQLLKQYSVYAGAYNYGIAVRKDSPNYAMDMQALREGWAKSYPGIPMDEYLVKAIVPVNK
jgi:hypothetical protein